MKVMNKKMMGILASISIVSSAQAATLEGDVGHGKLGFSVKHMMLMNVTGGFDSFKATVTTANPEAFDKDTKMEVVAEAKSINTNNAKRDEHLRSPDFFEVEKFPSVKFVSDKVEKLKKDEYKITGQLTIRDVTKPVTLTAKYLGKNKDPWGNNKVAYLANGKINRTDFGLKWNKALDAGGVLVGDEVNLAIEMEFAVK